MLTIRFNLAAQTAEVTCETWVEAACLLGGIGRSKATAKQVVADLVQGAELAPQPQLSPVKTTASRKTRAALPAPAPNQTPARRKPVRGRSAEEKRAMHREHNARWRAKNKEKREAEPAPPTQRSRRAQTAEIEELTRPKSPRDDLIDPELPRCERKGNKMFGAGTAVLVAFKKSQDYPLERLMRHIYGSESIVAKSNLNKLLEQMVYSAKTLKKVGPKSYTLTQLGKDALERGLEKARAVQA